MKSIIPVKDTLNFCDPETLKLFTIMQQPIKDQIHLNDPYFIFNYLNGYELSLHRPIFDSLIS